jgi:hypothetical protein
MRFSHLSVFKSSCLMDRLPESRIIPVMHGTLPIALLLVSCFVTSARPVEAQDQVASEEASPPTLDLDRLLRPRVTPQTKAVYGGKDRETWVEDFSEARVEVAELELKVADAQVKYRAASSAEWAYSPAGGGAPMDPEVLRIRAEIKRDRQSLEAARRRLRELGVEASLAGVPEEWTRPPAQEDWKEPARQED